MKRETPDQREARARKLLAERRMKSLCSIPPAAEDAKRFRELFGVELADYWLGILKLDVIKFDEFVKPRKNESTSEALVRRFGQQACNFVRGLL